MQRLFLCAVLFIGTAPSYGLAGARPGIEAGLNLSALRYDDQFSSFASSVGWNPGWRPSFTGGATLEIPFRGRLALATGLRYVQQGNRVKYDAAIPALGQVVGELRIMQHYLSMPVALEYRPWSSPRFFLSLGPEIALLISARFEQTSTGVVSPDGFYSNIKNELESTNLSLDAGVGYEFPMENHIGVTTLRYTYGLTGVAQEGEWIGDWKTQGVEWLVGMRW